MELHATHDTAGNRWIASVSPPPIVAFLDEPAEQAEIGDFCRFSGWVVSSGASPVTVRALYAGRCDEFALSVDRDDIYAAHHENYPHLQRRCDSCSISTCATSPSRCRSPCRSTTASSSRRACR